MWIILLGLIPSSLVLPQGRNLICIHSKKHIRSPPELFAQKQEQNLNSMQVYTYIYICMYVFSVYSSLLPLLPSRRHLGSWRLRAERYFGWLRAGAATGTRGTVVPQLVTVE